MKYVVILLLGCIFTTPVVFAESGEGFSSDVRERLYACGSNSLYLFLKLKGVAVSADDLKANVKIGPNGTSFYDLETASNHLGVPARTVQCSYETLNNLAFPVIAWIDRNSGEHDPVQTIIGHFVVLYPFTASAAIAKN